MGYPLSGHLVAEVRDIDDEPLLQLVGGKSIETVVSHNVLDRLLMMSAQQPGFAQVFDALLGFEGQDSM